MNKKVKCLLLSFCAIGISFCIHSTQASACPASYDNYYNTMMNFNSDKNFDSFDSYNSYEDFEKDMNKYVSINNTTVTFDKEKAIRDNKSKEFISLGTIINKLNATTDDKKVSYALSRMPSMPVYGNWCGPNHGSGKPIDVLDAGCKNHDFCYGHDGYFSCNCNKILINYIDANYSRMGKKEKIYASTIKYFFKAIPCRNTVDSITHG